MQFDETGPNTHTRRYWVSATVAIGAMIVFAILSILLLLGVVFGSPAVKPSPIRLSRGRLLVFAVAGVAMFVANKRSGTGRPTPTRRHHARPPRVRRRPRART